ncbi:MAG TPA: protein-disulfide reductase DsbD domain-containing protein [Bryobacteraceae bacterium]|jgi:DsbC/DsbD-like thiol-disulfide interchange protein
MRVISLLLAVSALMQAQTITMMLTPPMSVTAKRGATVAVKVQARLRDGYHCNTNTPSDEYLIPLKLTWTAPGSLQVADVKYPKGTMEKYPFSEKPLSVYSGVFDIVTDFKVPSDAKPGQSTIAGKVRYQACDDRACYPPKTLEVQVPVIIE